MSIDTARPAPASGPSAEDNAASPDRQAPPGLRGVVVADTKIGGVRGDAGFYHYREHAAPALARERSFEAVWRLFLAGALPTADEEAAFAREAARARVLPAEAEDALAQAALLDPLSGLALVLARVAALEGHRPLLDSSPDERRAQAFRLVALTPTILAAAWRISQGREPVAPQPRLGAAADWLRMISGTTPDEPRAKAVERYLVATVDHGFNASTFTARVVASTGASLAWAVSAALGALSGPLHGGAPGRALELFDEIWARQSGTARTDQSRSAAEVVAEKLARGERIMGFGHRVYRTADPRAELLRESAREIDPRYAAKAETAQRQIESALRELKPGRELHVNVEFYAGVVLELAGVPRELFTPTFAVSRIVGWAANALEQAEDSAIYRPLSRYVGPEPPGATRA